MTTCPFHLIAREGDGNWGLKVKPGISWNPSEKRSEDFSGKGPHETKSEGSEDTWTQEFLFRQGHFQCHSWKHIISMSLFPWKVPWAISLDKVSGMAAYLTFQVTLLSSFLLPVSEASSLEKSTFQLSLLGMENVKGHATLGLLHCRQTLYPLSHQGSGVLFLPNMQNVNITRNPQPRILPRAKQKRLPKKCSGRC